MEKAYKVKLNKKNLIQDLDIAELEDLVDQLISEQKLLQSDFENKYGYKFKAKYAIDHIVNAIKKDDSENKTDTYDILIEFLKEHNRNTIVDYLENSPDRDPDITACFSLAEGIRLNGNLLPKIWATVSGKWNFIVEELGKKDQNITKEVAFNKWFNYEGYKEGELQKLLKRLYSHSEDCIVDWKLLKSHLENV